MLPVSRLSDEGLEFAFESSAKPLGFAIGLSPASEFVRLRLADVRRIEDWAPDEFRLRVSLDDDSLVIEGGGKTNPAASLPPGRYTLRFAVSETKLANGTRGITIPEDGEVALLLDELPSNRQLTIFDRSLFDDDTRAVCERADSRIDGMDPFSWLVQPLPRIARKVCLLNLLAKARSVPVARPGESLCSLIDAVRWVDVDRINVTAGAGLLTLLRGLPEWRDPEPIHPMHLRNIARIFGGSPDDYDLESFREPVTFQSLQVVCATHKESGRLFGEFDIDLGNPKLDLAGFFVHVGELIDPGRTNHLDFFNHLAGGAAADFLYYRLDHVLAQPAGT